MARKRLTIDEKIERQKDIVTKAKNKYDKELEELNSLMQKRDEIHQKELMDAISRSDKTYDEIMDFLSGEADA